MSMHYTIDNHYTIRDIQKELEELPVDQTEPKTPPRSSTSITEPPAAPKRKRRTAAEWAEARREERTQLEKYGVFSKVDKLPEQAVT